MMYRLFAAFMVIITIMACSGQKKSANSRSNAVKVVPDDAVVDSADYFDRGYSVTYISGEKRVYGKWNVQKMYRWPGSGSENLIGVTLTLADSLFAGRAPCNSIAGTCILNGNDIQFKDIVSTKMACSNQEQETTYLNLLQNSVASFGFKDKGLLLRDGYGNTVFECLKDE